MLQLKQDGVNGEELEQQKSGVMEDSVCFAQYGEVKTSSWGCRDRAQQLSRRCAYRES